MIVVDMLGRGGGFVYFFEVVVMFMKLMIVLYMFFMGIVDVVFVLKYVKSEFVESLFEFELLGILKEKLNLNNLNFWSFRNVVKEEMLNFVFEMYGFIN